jgi:hypothetical protein
MNDDREEGSHLSLDDAQRLLNRAAELERGASVSLQHVREVAAETGIQSGALNAALREWQEDRRTTGDSTRPPWWVRVTLLGVPDRPAALVYYWLFLAGIILLPLSTFFTTRIPFVLALGLTAILVMAVYTTSAAIKWFDAHGWPRHRPSAPLLTQADEEQ